MSLLWTLTNILTHNNLTLKSCGFVYYVTGSITKTTSHDYV